MVEEEMYEVAGKETRWIDWRNEAGKNGLGWKRLGRKDGGKDSNEEDRKGDWQQSTEMIT